MKKILLMIALFSLSGLTFAGQIVFEGKIAPELRVKFSAYYHPKNKIPGVCGSFERNRHGGPSGRHFEGSKQVPFKVSYDQEGNYRATLNTNRADGGICGWEYNNNGTVEFHSTTGSPHYTWTGWSTRNYESNAPYLARCSFGSMYVSCSFDNYRWSELKVSSQDSNTIDFVLNSN